MKLYRFDLKTLEMYEIAYTVFWVLVTSAEIFFFTTEINQIVFHPIQSKPVCLTALQGEHEVKCSTQ